MRFLLFFLVFLLILRGSIWLPFSDTNYLARALTNYLSKLTARAKLRHDRTALPHLDVATPANKMLIVSNAQIINLSNCLVSSAPPFLIMTLQYKAKQGLLGSVMQVPETRE